VAIVVGGVAGSGRQLLLFFLLFCVASSFCFCPLYFSVSFVSYGEGVIVDNWEDSGSWWWLCGRHMVHDGYSPFLSYFSLFLLPRSFPSVNKVSPISIVASWWCSYSWWIIMAVFGGTSDLGGDGE